MTLYQRLSGGLSATDHREITKEKAAQLRLESKEAAMSQRENPPDPHDTLTALGMMEGPIGSSANLLNSSLYALEGKGSDALWELTGALPVIGMLTPHLKALKKSSSVVDEALKYYKLHYPRSPILEALRKLDFKVKQYMTTNRGSKLVKASKNPKTAKKHMTSHDKRILDDVDGQIDGMIDEFPDDTKELVSFRNNNNIGSAADEIVDGVDSRVVEDLRKGDPFKETQKWQTIGGQKVNVAGKTRKQPSTGSTIGELYYGDEMVEDEMSDTMKRVLSRRGVEE